MEAASLDCPVAALQTPDGDAAQWLVGQLLDNGLNAETTGATLFGPNSANWPGWWYDAVTVVETQKAVERTERARQDDMEMRK